MKIASIKARQFGAYDELDLELPEHGVVRVHGHNGSGKSTIVEAVMWALTGKSIRRLKLSRSGSVVEITTDQLIIARSQHGAKTELTWRFRDAAQAAAYESKTHSQDALEEHGGIGDAEEWLREHYYAARSKKNVDGFFEATDAERKRILEQALGLDEKFAKAVKAAAAELAAETKTLTGILTEQARLVATLQQLDNQIAGDKQELERARAPLSFPDRDSVFAARDAALDDSVNSIEAERLAQEAEAAAAAQYNAASQRAAECRRDYNLARDAQMAAACPTCQRPYDGAQGAVTDFQPLIAACSSADYQASTAQQALRIAEGTAAGARLRRTTAAAHYTALSVTAARLDAVAVERVAQRERAIEDWARRVDGAQVRQVDLTTNLAGVEVRRLTQTNILRLAELAAEALEPQGFRAWHLRQVVERLASRINYWLARLHPTMRVVFENTKQLVDKKRAPVDEIVVRVEGVGAEGYGGVSNGEGRRLDIAVMLGLAEATFSSASTLFFDEAFDTLDEDGLRAVGDLLGELGETKSVLVITHRDFPMKVAKQLVAHRGVLSQV